MADCMHCNRPILPTQESGDRSPQIFGGDFDAPSEEIAQELAVFAKLRHPQVDVTVFRMTWGRPGWWVMRAEGYAHAAECQFDAWKEWEPFSQALKNHIAQARADGLIERLELA